MRVQHVIHLGIDSCVLHTWQGRGYTPVSSYAPHSGNAAGMLAFLRQNDSGTIGIIVDVLEEEHSRERIARLGQRDQHAMLERKLARVFPRTEFATATVQGRATDSAHGQDVLFSALTKPDHLRTLVEQLTAAKLPLAGICSPALLSLPVVDKLQSKTGQHAATALLVTRDLEGRLRLAFFRNRRLISSRLLRKSLSARPGDMSRLLRQLEESVRYFDPSFIVNATNPVDVWLLGEPDAAAGSVTAAGGGHEGFHLHPVSLDSVTAALGIKVTPAAGPGGSAVHRDPAPAHACCRLPASRWTALFPAGADPQIRPGSLHGARHDGTRCRNLERAVAAGYRAADPRCQQLAGYRERWRAYPFRIPD